MGNTCPSEHVLVKIKCKQKNIQNISPNDKT